MSAEVVEQFVHSGVLTTSRNNRSVFAQELPVAQCHSAAAVDPDHVLVMLSHLHDAASFVPLPGISSDLVLEADGITDGQWR